MEAVRFYPADHWGELGSTRVEVEVGEKEKKEDELAKK